MPDCFNIILIWALRFLLLHLAQCVVLRVMMDLLPIHLAMDVCHGVTCSNPVASLALVVLTLPNLTGACVHAMQDMQEKPAWVIQKNLMSPYPPVISI